LSAMMEALSASRALCAHQVPRFAPSLSRAPVSTVPFRATAHGYQERSRPATLAALILLVAASGGRAALSSSPGASASSRRRRHRGAQAAPLRAGSSVDMASKRMDDREILQLLEKQGGWKAKDMGA
ncbi:unnamed protein product, partial [Polarella glacialis]